MKGGKARALRKLAEFEANQMEIPDKVYEIRNRRVVPFSVFLKPLTHEEVEQGTQPAFWYIFNGDVSLGNCTRKLYKTLKKAYTQTSKAALAA